MRRLFVPLFVTTVFAVSCSALVDLSGLAGHEDTDAAVVDGAATRDGTVPVDEDANAKVDGSQAIDAGPDATFCQMHTGHTFCVDFDESSSVPGLDSLSDPNHQITIDTTVAASGPNSLRLIYTQSPSNFQAESLGKTLPAGQHLTLSMDIRADYTFSSGQVIAMWLETPTGGTVSGHELYIESYGGPLRFIEAVDALDGGGTSYNGGAFPMAAPAGTFAHLDIVIDGVNGKATVDQNGTRVETLTLTQGFPSGPLHLYLGRFANSVKGGDAVFHIDNVLVDVN